MTGLLLADAAPLAVSARRPRSADVRLRPRTPSEGYGRANPRRSSISAVIQPDRWARSQPLTDKADKAEAIYESRRKEPLGKPAVRGFAPPIAAAHPDFRFGVRTSMGSSLAEALMPNAQDEDPVVHRRYVVSHKAFSPGEQVDRRYEWPQKVADPYFAFGRPAVELATTAEGAGICLSGREKRSGEAVEAAETHIVPEISETMRRTKDYPLGRARLPMNGPVPVPEGFTYGKPSGQDRLSAAECIRHSYPTQDQRPDVDLGRSVRYGRRNVDPLSACPPYGRPSRKYDDEELSALADSRGSAEGLRKPPFGPPSRGWEDGGEMERVIKMDEPDGKYEAEFRQPKSQEQARKLFADAGHPMGCREFSALWQRASRASGKKVTLNALIKAYAAAPRPRSGRLPGT